MNTEEEKVRNFALYNDWLGEVTNYDDVSV